MVVPMLSRRLSRPWKFYFIAMVAVQCMALSILLRHLVATSGSPIDHVDTLLKLQATVALTVPLLLAIWDRKGDEGWLHWLGLGMNSVWFGIVLYSSI